MHRLVEHLGQARTRPAGWRGRSDSRPAGRGGKGCGRRRSHLRSRASILAADRPSQIACRRLRSAQDWMPLSSASKAMPSWASCRLAYSWPFRQSLALNESRWSGRTMARSGLRMMPTFPLSPLKFRTAGFPRYGLKAGRSGGAFPGVSQLKPAPACADRGRFVIVLRASLPSSDPRSVSRMRA